MLSWLLRRTFMGSAEEQLGCFHMCYGPEFTSKAMFFWSKRAAVKLHFIQPGKPTQNAIVESFNGKFRDYCLNLHWFTSLVDATGTRSVAVAKRRWSPGADLTALSGRPRRQRVSYESKATGILQIDGGQGQNRTADTRIFSPLLYRLSYLAVAGGLLNPLVPTASTEGLG